MILMNRKFRDEKEYIVIAANLMHELLYGSYYLFSGINKSSVYLNNIYLPIWDRRTCFPQIIFTITALSGSGLIALSSAIDRFLAVIIPIRYMGFSTNYAIWLTSSIYMTILIVLVISTIIVSNNDYGSVQITSTCEFSGTTYPIINAIVRILRAGTTIIGLCLYFPITWKLREIFYGTGSFQQISQAQRKNLIRYNIIVSAIVLNELFLTVLPDVILIFLPDTPYRYALFTLTLVKDLINVIVINFMQKHLYLHYLNKILRTAMSTRIEPSIAIPCLSKALRILLIETVQHIIWL
uniref:G-protein coupled receptors family 1 profile domain-containing protein n=1 Tax=Acrobeloides nanus TaxID=290746 RepID=A0A914BV88_9BILA